MGKILTTILGFLSGTGATRLLGKGVAVVTKIEIYLWALIIIGTGLSALGYDFLIWALNPETIKLSYTQLDNPIIKVGFEITQSLVNMALLLVLIYVALSIALRLIQETAAKKLLVYFILVALLVNFAPVLTGLIVDGANIIMNEFVKPIINTPLAGMKLFEPSKAGIDKLGWFIGEGAILGKTQDLIIAVWIIIYNYLLALVFFTFGGILILRYLAIWVLVILSPLAFVCFIIPQTQKYWKLWRDEFLKWSFIGVPVAFFLYLAFYFVIKIEEIVAPMPEIEPVLSSLLIYSIPLFFFYLALRMATKSTAWGVATAVGLGSSLLRKGVPWTYKKGKEALHWTTSRPEIRRGMERVAGGLEKIPLAGAPIAGSVYRYTHRREEEFKKELEGLPLRLQARHARKSIQEMIQRLSPRQFRDLTPADISIEAFFGTNMAQLDEVSQRGSLALRRAIRNTVRMNSGRIVEEWKRLTGAGQKREATELLKKFERMRTDPNYQV